jgi:hypothetical protein
MGSARIENKDSKEYVLSVKVSGSGGTIKIPKGTTTVSWNGGSHDAVVESGGVSFPSGRLVNNGAYVVSGGKASSR